MHFTVWWAESIFRVKLLANIGVDDSAREIRTRMWIAMAKKDCFPFLDCKLNMRTSVILNWVHETRLIFPLRCVLMTMNPENNLWGQAVHVLTLLWDFSTICCVKQKHVFVRGDVKNDMAKRRISMHGTQIPTLSRPNLGPKDKEFHRQLVQQRGFFSCSVQNSSWNPK